jgi:hypothetical protein
MAWLTATHPELVDRYRALYRGGSYADKRYQRRITEQVAGYARELGIGRDNAGGPRRITPQGDPSPPQVPAPAPEQLRLL